MSFNLQSTTEYENRDHILQELEKHGGICDCQGSRYCIKRGRGNWPGGWNCAAPKIQVTRFDPSGRFCLLSDNLAYKFLSSVLCCIDFLSLVENFWWSMPLSFMMCKVTMLTLLEQCMTYLMCSWPPMTWLSAPAIKPRFTRSRLDIAGKLSTSQQNNIHSPILAMSDCVMRLCHVRSCHVMSCRHLCFRDTLIYAASAETTGLPAVMNILSEVVLRPNITDNEVSLFVLTSNQCHWFTFSLRWDSQHEVSVTSCCLSHIIMLKKSCSAVSGRQRSQLGAVMHDLMAADIYLKLGQLVSLVVEALAHRLNT